MLPALLMLLHTILRFSLIFFSLIHIFIQLLVLIAISFLLFLFFLLYSFFLWKKNTAMNKIITLHSISHNAMKHCIGSAWLEQRILYSIQGPALIKFRLAVFREFRGNRGLKVTFWDRATGEVFGIKRGGEQGRGLVSWNISQDKIMSAMLVL